MPRPSSFLPSKLNGDTPVPASPDSTISSLHFGSGASSSLLLSTCWGKDASLWQLSSATQAAPRAKVSCAASLLCSSFADASDGSRVFLGGCDHAVYAWALATGQLQKVGAHSAPVKEVAYSAEHGCVISASWDASLRYWDTRAPSAQATVALSGRAFCMDVRGTVLVVATSDRMLSVYDTRKPTVPFRPPYPSPLRFQSRCVAVCPDREGFLLGSIEGRVACQHIRPEDAAKNFAFRAHRDPANNDIFPVNSIAFHPTHGTFATAGVMVGGRRGTRRRGRG